MSKLSFILKAAFRDSRKNWGRLFMFMSSIVLGITALVAINSFNYNLVKDINEQSKPLLGADLKLSANKKLPENLQLIVDSLPGEKAYEAEFFSMSYIPKSDETQFVRIKALEGQFPFYGKLVTQPVEAANNYLKNGSVLVDDGLMYEHSLTVGDSIKLGQKTFEIEGRLMSLFGSVSLGSGFAPAVYMAENQLAQTELVKTGSMVEHAYYFKLPDTFDAEEWENNKGRRKAFRNESFRSTTLEDQTRNLENAFSSLNSFLNLIALVALILGCIGVASSVFIYVKSKIKSIAVLRCLGAKGKDAFWIYFSQIFILGFLSVLVGCVLGSAIQIILPEILSDILPYQVKLSISPKAIIEGLLIGSLITGLFALLPLLSIRKISPLRTLRASLDNDIGKRDPIKFLVYLAIPLSFIGFLYSITNDWKVSVFFVVGIIISFLLLFGLATLVMWLVRHFFPSRFSFVLRQGISNLFRPNNQTRTLIISIGLGTAILTTLYVIQGLILSNVEGMEAGNQPNMVLYGIETSQVQEVEEITKSYDMPVVQNVPIVTMKLAAWKGRTRSEWMKDTLRRSERWAVNREARVSYRDTISSDEELLEGVLRPYNTEEDSVFISLDEGYADALNVELGDELIWNVQGTMITTYVGSLREINFRSMRTRFFILFPSGVLESAPQFHVLVTKTPSNTVMADYRRKIVKRFPNVSSVDLGSILVTLNDIISKISYVIKFMAAFSILTGLIVLISSLLLSKFQRIKESVLLRTLGASRAQVFKINAIEYLILGSLSALTGIIIALVAAYLIATQQMELDFNIKVLPIVVIFLLVTILTVLIGLFNTSEVVRKSPLEVLRRELA